MSIEQRENFVGLLTNASGMVAPPGSLLEAENVVIRRPGAIEPRNGLQPDTAMNGSEVMGFAHGTRDIVVRYSSISGFTYLAYPSTPLTNPPQPLRRDVLTATVGRGNLYVPGYDGVWRLLPGSTAFERAGLMMESHMGSSLTFGPVAPSLVTGMTAFTTATFLENAAGQGPAPAATWWLAVMFYLNAIPVTAEPLVS